MWNKFQYFDSQPIIWVCKISLFSMLKIFLKCLKSVYLFAWGIEKQHKKAEIMWWKIEYFHSQPIIRYTHFKNFFSKFTKFELFFQFLPKLPKSTKTPYSTPLGVPSGGRRCPEANGASGMSGENVSKNLKNQWSQSIFVRSPKKKTSSPRSHRYDEHMCVFF